MEGSALRNLRMFRQLCGEEFMKNVILGTTFWDIVGEETGTARENELLRTDGFFKEMNDLGCDVVRISDTRDSNLELLSRFAAKQPAVMRIQQELLVEGKSLSETAAASAISQELAELQRRNLEKLADSEHQAQKIFTRSVLEKAYTRQLARRAFGETITDLNAQQEEVRKEQEEREMVDEESLATLHKESSRQDQNFQVQLNELNEQLRALRASTTC
jgi:anion-transporting  ArsA/GET3 family ATPase